ncbi:TraR/DksA C4-type zinc finger protein [Jatrophihabitans endophyticus]|uniref:TraR/DksA family transcriptional regulator n=1 Tax=Jatrophihabitans endophyticus TaxID=1206085 RepID=UPI0019EDDA2D|nr:TraR/DksA C4-type zinc finger protein [Jatrophihabitans endophyticus]MBE7187251.1 hypothetical protein [Jatrophihabitans endophyticus]
MTTVQRPTLPDHDLLAILRARLEIQRDFRIDQLAALESMVPPPPGSAQDEIVTSLCAGAASALRQTREALQRLDEDSYGLCTECDAALPLEQLAAVPQAPLCPRCASRLAA